LKRDILKFFQAYVAEMIEIGGSNFPKTISSSLGEKLGKIYKTMEVVDIKDGLKKIYDLLEIPYEIRDLEDGKFEVEVKYDENFCPIGGEFNPEKAKLIQESICSPYIIGFLSELDTNYKYSGCVKQCILADNHKICRYIVEREE